jgi:hypothetical protein
MMPLRQALELYPWRFLLFIGRRRGLKFSSKIRKVELVDRLAQSLAEPGNARAALAGLSAPAQAALADLLIAGGQAPRRYLRLRHGDLRPYRQTPGHYNPPEPEQIPDEAGLSPLEQLRAAGLIFYDPATHDLFIPSDLIAHFPAPDTLSPAKDDTVMTVPEPAPVDLLCHDLVVLLALLQKEDVVPLHGRWLPPNFLRQWEQHCAIPAAIPAARSELQTGRRRFLHYLAEAAGFVIGHSSLVTRHSSPQKIGKKRQMTNDKGQMTSLTPTPTAWLWLNSTRQERLQTLWQAWSRPDPERWRRFRLPGYDWLTNPAALLDPLHRALLEIDPADPAAFADMFLRREPQHQGLAPATLLEPVEVLTQTVVALLTEPLVWLGVLSTFGNEQLIINNSSFLLFNSSFTDDEPSFAKFSITSDIQPDPLASALTLTLADGLPDPADLMVAIEVGSREYGVGGLEKTSPASYSLLLTPYSFIQSLHRGWSPPALLAALNRLARRALGSREVELLKTWAEVAHKVIISPAVLLETSDPGVITRLASTRRGRPLTHRTLSPRAVVVDPAKLPQLIRRLTEQEGAPPRVTQGNSKELKGTKGSSASPSVPLSSSQFLRVPSSSDAAHLWLMLKVYQNLGQHIQLPVRIPQSLVDRLAEMLSPAAMAGAEVAAEQTLAALRRALDGQTPFPPWPEGGLPVEKSLAVIEQAMAAGQNIQLLYYAASTDRLTRRVVEPYRVEWRGAGSKKYGVGSRGARGEGSVPVEVEGQGSRGAPSRAQAGEQGSLVLGSEEQSEIQNPKLGTRNSEFGTPYLIGFCHHTQAERMFRLDRIREIEIVDRH